MKPSTSSLYSLFLISTALPLVAQGTTSVVTSLSDSGAGSLRSTLALVAATPGAETITFSSDLSGQSIVLSSEIIINDVDGVTVDASSLPNGITITDTGDVDHRLFFIVGGIAGFKNLTMTNGGGSLFSANSRNGGAILNHGTLSLVQCTLSGNTASSGGAISSVTNSDFVTSKTSLNLCTLSGNTATAQGGAIDNSNGLTVISHCTIANNSAPTDSGGGISSAGNSSTQTRIQYSLVVQNVSSNTDIVLGSASSFSSLGYNIVGTGNATGSFNQAGDQINPSNLNLSSLGNFGGATQTIALLPSSRARNAAIGSSITGDQRGFPVVGVPDIGAYEAGTATNFNAWISESLPANTPLPQYGGSFDYDGDGQSNLLEYATLGNPTVAGGGQNLILTRNAIGSLASLVIPYRFSAPGLTYVIERSSNLGTWTPIANVDSGTNLIFPAQGIELTGSTSQSITLRDNTISGEPKFFYRLKAAIQ